MNQVSKPEASIEQISFEFENYNGELIVMNNDCNAWVSDGEGNSWDVAIALPNNRTKTGHETQTLEQIEGDGDYDDCYPKFDHLLPGLEESFDNSLRSAIEDYLEDKYVTTKCPRGFANEVVYTIHDGESDDDESESLIDHLMSEIHGLDASRVEFA